MSITVPRRPGHRARTVTLAIRFAPVRFGPPAHQVKYRGQSEAIALWALSAQEENPEPGCEPICWRLLSTQRVDDAAGAITQVQRYTRRWQIELFHKILKSGCRIEERQFGSAERIGVKPRGGHAALRGRCLVLDVIVAPFDCAQGTRARIPAHPRASPRIPAHPRASSRILAHPRASSR